MHRRGRERTIAGEMVAVKTFGWVFLIAAAFVFASDVRLWYATGDFEPIRLSQMWIEINSGSFARVGSDLTPWLGEMLRQALSIWAAPTVAAAGLMLVWLGMRRR